MAIRLDHWVRSLCQEALYANTDYVLAQRNTFMALLKDQYHQFFLHENCFMNIEDMKFSLYLIPVKEKWWLRAWHFVTGKKKQGFSLFKIGNAAHFGALHCEITISRAGSAFGHEIKMEGQKLKNEEIYVEET